MSQAVTKGIKIWQVKSYNICFSIPLDKKMNKYGRNKINISNANIGGFFDTFTLFSMFKF